VCGLAEDYEVVAVPTRYPAGGAKQLIRVLTGKEVPASKRSTELAVQCFNVATVYTAYRALAHGEPVVSRIVTLTGNVERPRNWEVRLGTPLRDLVALGRPKADTSRYLMGGPMMGFALPSLDAPVVKATNCIIAASPTMFPASPPEMPCIRCGACAEVCPHELQPLSCTGSRAPATSARHRSTTSSTASSVGAAATSALRTSHWCSTFVLPRARSGRASGKRTRPTPPRPASSCATRARSVSRPKKRRRAPARAPRPLLKAGTEKKPMAPASADTAVAGPAATAAAPVDAAPAAPAVDAEAVKKATIVAAMERARAQREAAQPRNTEQLSREQQQEIAAIEARRARVAGEAPGRAPAAQVRRRRLRRQARHERLHDAALSAPRAHQRAPRHVAGAARPAARCAAYVWLIGPIVLLQLVIATLAALAGEALMLGLRRKPLALFLSDGSALVTAWLVALAFPPLAPGGWSPSARCSRSSSPNSSTVAWARIPSIRRWSPLPCASSPFRP
jgi:electron transport complex protein RnfC